MHLTLEVKFGDDLRFISKIFVARFRREHEKHLAKFGIYQSTFLPTLYIELAENRYKLSVSGSFFLQEDLSCV